MLEKQLQKRILDYLSKEPNTYPMKTLTMNMRGLPDILICHRGIFCFIEIKAPGRAPKPTKLQQKRIDDLQDCGALGFVVNDYEIFIMKWNGIKRIVEHIKNPTADPSFDIPNHIM